MDVFLVVYLSCVIYKDNVAKAKLGTLLGILERKTQVHISKKIYIKRVLPSKFIKYKVNIDDIVIHHSIFYSMAVLTTGFLIFDILFLFLGGLLALYVYYKHAYQYWKRKGVPYLKPKFLVGNNPWLLPKTSTFAGEAKIWYDELKKRGDKFGGAYSFARPVLVLVDPDYIRDVLSQDFQYFINRDFYVNEKHDPRFTHLFNIKNSGWKPLRQKLTPTFSSGKMKMMFNSILACSNNMINYLENYEKIGDDVHIREVLTSFTTDVIGNVAFGIDCNSFVDTQGEFKRHGREFFTITLSLYIKGFFTKLFPVLSKQIGIKLGKEETKDFFAKVIKESMEYREKNNIRRPDFLQLLVDMNNESKDGEKLFSFNEIVANSLLFFIAGYDTSSTLMTYTLYELSRSQAIQEKVREEINRVLKNNKGVITYDALQEMTYLRQVCDETMRIHPPVLTLARVCTKDYQLRDTNIIINKGTSVVVSTVGLGRDPEYFPDPMKFDPDRFTPEQREKRHPYIHLPFGEGPRNCIGLRFGVMQAKIGLVRVLSRFKVKMSPKTKTPITYDPKLFLNKETETIYLNIEKI